MRVGDSLFTAVITLSLCLYTEPGSITLVRCFSSAPLTPCLRSASIKYPLYRTLMKRPGARELL